MDWSAIFGAVFGAAVVAVGWWMTARRERRKSKRDAAARLCAAFAEAATQLEAAGGEDPHSLMIRSAMAHDAAVFEYRSFLDPSERTRFDAAFRRFRDYRDAIEPRLLGFMRSQVSGQPVDHSTTTALRESIRALLDFASNE